MGVGRVCAWCVWWWCAVRVGVVVVVVCGVVCGVGASTR